MAEVVVVLVVSLMAGAVGYGVGFFVATRAVPRILSRLDRVRLSILADRVAQMRDAR